MRWLTLKEAAAYVRSSKERLYSAAYAGELAAHKLSAGSPAIVSTDALDAWVKSHPTVEKGGTSSKEKALDESESQESELA